MRVAIVTVSTEAFLVLEGNLASKLTEAVYNSVKSPMTAIAKLVVAGEYAKAGTLVSKLDVSGAVEDEEKTIKLSTIQSILFGARDYSPAKETRTFADGIPDVVNKATATALIMFARMLGEGLRNALHREIDKLESDATENVVQKASKVTEFVSFGKGKLNSSALAASSLHTSRLATFGLVTEATLTGHTTYKISEVLDIKICPICKTMDGKVFEVATALEQVVRLLDVSDPEELKSLAPFPRQDKSSVKAFRAMSDDGLVNAGWNKPPFHIMCRGILRKTSQSVAVVENPPINTNDLIRLIEEGALEAPDYLADAVAIGVASDAAIDNPQ